MLFCVKLKSQWMGFRGFNLMTCQFCQNRIFFKVHLRPNASRDLNMSVGGYGRSYPISMPRPVSPNILLLERHTAQISKWPSGMLQIKSHYMYVDTFMYTYKDISKPHSSGGMMRVASNTELVQWTMRNAFTDCVEDQLVETLRCRSTRQTLDILDKMKAKSLHGYFDKR